MRLLLIKKISMEVMTKKSSSLIKCYQKNYQTQLINNVITQN